MIKPTVGRVVWFWPGAPGVEARPEFLTLAGAGEGAEPQPCSASIAYVFSDRLVNLTVSDHYGRPHNFTSVTLLQGDDARPSAGYFAEWMPYQVGQAKKVDAADKADKVDAADKGA